MSISGFICSTEPLHKNISIYIYIYLIYTNTYHKYHVANIQTKHMKRVMTHKKYITYHQECTYLLYTRSETDTRNTNLKT